jgi:hypothetical protein
MAKGKKKDKKKVSLIKKIKSAIPDNRLLYAVLGGVGAGLAIGAALDKEKRQAVIDKVSSTIEELSRPTAESSTTGPSDAKNAAG